MPSSPCRPISASPIATLSMRTYKAISDAVTIPDLDSECRDGARLGRPDRAPVQRDRARELGQGRGPPQHPQHQQLVGQEQPGGQGRHGRRRGTLHDHRARPRRAWACMHACQFCDIVQRIWELLDAGKQDEAGDLFEIVLPGLVLEGLMGMAFAKEIMMRRGVFKNYRMRGRIQAAGRGRLARDRPRLEAHRAASDLAQEVRDHQCAKASQGQQRIPRIWSCSCVLVPWF